MQSPGRARIAADKTDSATSEGAGQFFYRISDNEFPITFEFMRSNGIMEYWKDGMLVLKRMLII